MLRLEQNLVRCALEIEIEIEIQIEHYRDWQMKQTLIQKMKTVRANPATPSTPTDITASTMQRNNAHVSTTYQSKGTHQAGNSVCIYKVSS